MSGSVSDYIARLEQQLRQRGIADPRVLAEAREHLIDAIEVGRERGLSPADAEHEAFERFGAPEIVAAHILKEREPMKTGIAGAFGAIWHRKWSILVPTVLAAVVTAVMSDYQPVRYQAYAIILAVPPQENSVRSSVPTNIEDRLRSIDQQVRSRVNLERIIEDLNLYPERRKKDVMQDIVDDMSKAIDVDIVQDVLIRVAFMGDNARTAMQVTERLATLFVDRNAKERSTFAEGAMVFLETQMANTTRRLRATEQQIAEYKRLHDADLARDAELTELTRDYATLRSQFDNLSAKRLDAQVSASLERRQIGAQFRILDSARLSEQPVVPRRLRAALIGALVGLAAGLVLVGLRRSSNTNTRPPALAQA